MFDQIYYGRSMPSSDANTIYATARDMLPSDGDFHAALSAARESMSRYIDSHNYVFTSHSFEHIVNVLCDNDIIPFVATRHDHTPDDDMTFVSILRKKD